MNTIRKIVVLFMLFLHFFALKHVKAQICPINFITNVPANGGGLVNFSVTTPSLSPNNTYTWNFGPATSTLTGAAGLTQSYTYSLNGVYTVTLAISQSTPFPCTNVTQTTFTVNNICTSSPSFTFAQGSNGLVNFLNTSTGTVASTSYTWNFGNSTPTSSLNSPTHTYTANGPYTVTLFSRHSPTINCINSFSLPVVINSVCTLTPSFSYTSGANGNVTFINTTTPTTGVSYNWSFGNNITSTLVNPSNTYTANQIYTVTLVATTFSPACTATATSSISVNNVITPTCSIQFTSSPASPINACNGSAGVSFISGMCSPVTYTWNNGATVAGINNLCAGIYTVIASGGTGPGCCPSITATVAVSSIPCSIVADFTTAIGANGNVNFINASTGTNVSSSYYWTFSDLNSVVSSTLINPAITFTSAGTKTISLVVINPNNSLCNDSVIKTIFIPSVCSLSAAFSHTLGSGGLTNFSNLSSGLTGTANVLWDFGDGWKSSTHSPAHTYPTVGTYYLKLVVGNAPHCRDSLTQAINVTGIACTANASFNVFPASQPGYYNLVPVYPWNLSTAVWSWGDNSQSQGIYASHQYSASGNYEICLTVTASCGASATSCATHSLTMSAGVANTLVVNALPPAPQFEITGVNNEANKDIKLQVYPNPSQGKFNVLLNDFYSQKVNINVINSEGKIVFSTETIPSTEYNDVQVDLVNQATGIYILLVTLNEKRYLKKIIVINNE